MTATEAARLESIQFHRWQWPKESMIASLALMGLREANCAVASMMMMAIAVFVVQIACVELVRTSP